MNTIHRKPLSSVLDLGGAITISPDGMVNYLDTKSASAEVLVVLENADYAVLRHDTLAAVAEKFPNDLGAAADYLNEFYGLEEVR